MFKDSYERVLNEKKHRADFAKKILTFGVEYLDDAVNGILPNDLVLVAAPSGAGKTQFCVNLAISNVAQGRRVHYFALEAGPDEIERRIKYQLLAEKYFADEGRLYTPRQISYLNWCSNFLNAEFDPYEEEVHEYFKNNLMGLKTFYKHEVFSVNELIENVLRIEKETDLIIVDHVHYFDWDDESDNRAIKKIAMTARDLCLEMGKPIVLVSHLRKKDKFNKELVASMEELHGSSELYKISTKMITLAPGPSLADGKYISYFRFAKCRDEGGVTRFVGMVTYDSRRGTYEKGYKVGWANTDKFGELDHAIYPRWAKRT
jgi:replicative DNA helicase